MAEAGEFCALRILVSSLHSHPISIRPYVLAHLIAMPLTYREIFMFINFISKAERKCCVRLLVAVVTSFQSLDVFASSPSSRVAAKLTRRVNNNNGDAVNLISTRE